ncbi:hypothetical protein [Sinomicrobium sp. M5D2P9]
MNSQANRLAVKVTAYAVNRTPYTANLYPLAVKVTWLAAKGNGLAANRTTSGVKGIVLMAIFRALKRKGTGGFSVGLGTGKYGKEIRLSGV